LKGTLLLFFRNLFLVFYRRKYLFLASNLDVDGRVMVQCTVKIGLKNVDWIDLALDMDMWRAVVKAVMKIQIVYYKGNVLTNFGTINCYK
jgi:hypothetical protein